MIDNKSNSTQAQRPKQTQLCLASENAIIYLLLYPLNRGHRTAIRQRNEHDRLEEVGTTACTEAVDCRREPVHIEQVECIGQGSAIVAQAGGVQGLQLGGKRQVIFFPSCLKS